MKTEIIEYIPEHGLILLDRQVKEMDFCLSAVGDWESMVKYWHKSGPSFSLMVDDQVEACGGIAMIDKTFGECWVMVPNASKGMLIYRSILKKFLELVESIKFRRIQCHVIKDFSKGIKLAEHLGMKFEGWHPGFGANGETYGTFARVF